MFLAPARRSLYLCVPPPLRPSDERHPTVTADGTVDNLAQAVDMILGQRHWDSLSTDLGCKVAEFDSCDDGNSQEIVYRLKEYLVAVASKVFF